MDTENQVYVFVCDRLLKTGHYFLKFYDKPLAPSKSAKGTYFPFLAKEYSWYQEYHTNAPVSSKINDNATDCNR